MTPQRNETRSSAERREKRLQHQIDQLQKALVKAIARINSLENRVESLERTRDYDNRGYE